MSVHPALQAYLDELNPLIEAAAAAGIEPTAETARAGLAYLNKFALPREPVAEIFDSSIEYAPAEGEAPIRVPVRIYVPRPDTPCDVVFFVHGGGHMAGDLDVYDFSARRTAQATGMVVVSVDYRRSPEATFPAGLTDTYAVLGRLDSLLAQVQTTGRVHAFADSGGAAKVSSIAMRVAAGEWSSPIQRQVLLYPSLDYTMSGATIQELGKGYFLEAGRIEWYFDNYFQHNEDRALASPLNGPFTDTMPETLVIAAEYDPLRSEAEDYVARMQAAGSKAQLIVAPGMIHAFAFFESLVPVETARLYAVAAEFLSTGKASW